MFSETWPERIRRLEAVLHDDPDNVPARQELLRVHARYLNQTDHADDRIEMAFEMNLEVLYALSPRDPCVCEVLAGRVDPDYELRPPAGPEAVEPYREAMLALAEGDPWAAEEKLRLALLNEPDSIASHAQLARFAVERREWDTAWRHLDYALAQQPNSALLRFIAGEAWWGMGEPAKAFDEYITALAINPLCAQAEAQLVSLGETLGYRWLELPLRPAVWPLIEAGGRSWMRSDSSRPRAVRAAWRAWAEAVLRLCRELPPERTPLAGLPRDLEFLTATHRALLSAWRLARLAAPRRHPDTRLLNWLAAVDRAGLLPAYLLFSYLHPDLADDLRAWRAAHPNGMARFLRQFVVRRDGLYWPTRRAD